MTKTAFTATVLLLVVASHSAPQQPVASKAPTKGSFTPLKVGQSVTVRDKADRYEISVFDDKLPQSHTVVEIGSDYVALEDIGKITTLWIPVYSVKAIVVVKANVR